MHIRSLLLVSVAISLVGCSHEHAAAPVRRVAVLQVGSLPEARDLVTPAVLGLQLAISQAPGAEVTLLDTGGDDSRTLAAARSVAGDASVVAVVVAPFTPMPAEAREALLSAGVPMLSLSALDDRPAGRPHPPWRRFVASVSVQARALLRVAGNLHRREPTCVLGEDTAWSERLRAEIDRIHLGIRVKPVDSVPSEARAPVLSTGCGAALWTGTAPGAGALDMAIGGRIPLVLDDAARTGGFLTSRWPGGSSVLAVCSCADFSTRGDPVAQRFVHDYQATTGLDAGPFAVEGFDVGTWIARALQVGPSRGQVAARLARVTRFAGIARTYAWDRDGRSRDEGLRVYRAIGVHWIIAHRPQRALRRWDAPG